MIGGLNPINACANVRPSNKDADLPAASDGATSISTSMGPTMSLSAVLAPMSEIKQHHFTGSERQLYFSASQMPPMTRRVPCSCMTAAISRTCCCAVCDIVWVSSVLSDAVLLKHFPEPLKGRVFVKAVPQWPRRVPMTTGD